MRGEGVVFTESASKSMEVAFASSKIDASEEVVEVGERGGMWWLRGRVFVGVEGTEVPAVDDALGGSLDSTEVRGRPNTPPSPPADRRSPATSNPSISWSLGTHHNTR